MQLGTVIFSGVETHGKKHEFRLNSDARILKGIFLQINSVSAPFLQNFYNRLVVHGFTGHLFDVSILLNNAKDRVLSDVKIDRQLMQFVSEWNVASPDFRKYLGFEDMMIHVHTPIIPNAVHTAIVKPNEDLLTYRKTHTSTFDNVITSKFFANVKIEMTYKYE